MVRRSAIGQDGQARRARAGFACGEGHGEREREKEEGRRARNTKKRRRGPLIGKTSGHRQCASKDSMYREQNAARFGDWGEGEGAGVFKSSATPAPESPALATPLRRREGPRRGGRPLWENRSRSLSFFFNTHHNGGRRRRRRPAASINILQLSPVARGGRRSTPESPCFLRRQLRGGLFLLPPAKKKPRPPPHPSHPPFHASRSSKVLLSGARPITLSPLSTYITCPVTAELSGDTKNAAQAPTSAALSSFCTGAFA
jgi:hypothetical protein